MCRRPAHCGFSLIELLVVIAVISVLASMLMAAVGRAQTAARTAKCQNNMNQVYKGARLYSNAYDQMLPDLYAGLATTEHHIRYVNSNAARSEVTTGTGQNQTTTNVAAGLWLLYVWKQADSPEVFYCPELPGQRRYKGTENPTVDGLPERVGYMYNAFPDRATGENIVPLPEGLQLEEASNDISQTRKMSFYALLSDPFLTDRLVTHRARKGISVGYWDGSVQWIDMRARGILWNSEQADPEGGAAIKCFSEDKAGAIATRDTWVGLSGARQ